MLYVVRHGQTDMNRDGLICGRTDVPLNDAGNAQAEAAAREFSSSGVPIAKIFSSPLLRARQTAAYFARETGAAVAIEHRLIEQDYGRFEATDHRAQEFLEAKRNFAADFGGGESIFRIVQRVYNLLDELREQSLAENILLVSHGAVLRVIHTYFYSLTTDEFPVFYFGNCQLKAYDYAGKAAALGKEASL